MKSSSDEDEASDEREGKDGSSDAGEDNESENEKEVNPFLCDLTKGGHCVCFFSFVPFYSSLFREDYLSKYLVYFYVISECF